MKDKRAAVVDVICKVHGVPAEDKLKIGHITAHADLLILSYESLVSDTSLLGKTEVEPKVVKEWNILPK